MKKSLLMLVVFLISLGIEAHMLSECGTQGYVFPASLVGRAYSGVVEPHAKYSKNYNCKFTIIFITKEKCRVQWNYTLKEQRSPDNNLEIPAKMLSVDNTYILHYMNEEIGEINLEDSSGRMVLYLQDNGKKIKVMVGEGIHGEIYLLDDDECKRLLNQLGYNWTSSANLIYRDEISHRDYQGNIICSSLSQIEKLLNGDVAGYYNIPGITTEVQKKLFSQSDDYKNIYFPRFKKEREFLLEDEYEIAFRTNGAWGLDDIWGLKYDLRNHRFSFKLDGHYEEHYQLSNEKNSFHVLIKTQDCDFEHCLTYPKSLVAMVNRRGDNGKMLQEQTLYTGIVSEKEAAKFYPERRNSLLWRFKIEKVKKGRLYGKSTKLYIIEGEPFGRERDLEQRYHSAGDKDQPRKIVVDLSNTFPALSKTYKTVKVK